MLGGRLLLDFFPEAFYIPCEKNTTSALVKVSGPTRIPGSWHQTSGSKLLV